MRRVAIIAALFVLGLPLVGLGVAFYWIGKEI